MCIRDRYRGDATPDPSVLKKLRLLIETDDQQFPTLKKLKICGRNLEELPPEVFEMVELEVLELELRLWSLNYRHND